MPWKAEDARHHKKDLTNGEAAVWAETANHARQEYGDDATAIRVANSAINKRRRKPRRSF